MDFKGFVGGSVGGGVGILVGHPLDTIKVRLQAQHTNGGDAVKYKGLWDCIIKIFKYEGATGFFKGVTSPVIGFSGQNAILFGIQRYSMNLFGHDVRGEFQAGCFSGGIQTIASTPVELSKIQLQMQNIGVRIVSSKRTFGPISIMMYLYKNEGIRGPFRGYVVTFLRDCPGYGVYFASYAGICQLLTQKDQSRHSLGVGCMLLAGGLCGVISWIFCYPIDVVKTRIQAEGFQPHGRYKSYADCLRKIYAEGGLRIFTRGISTTLIRAFPVNAATLCAASLVERFLHNNT